MTCSTLFGARRTMSAPVPVRKCMNSALCKAATFVRSDLASQRSRSTAISLESPIATSWARNCTSSRYRDPFSSRGSGLAFPHGLAESRRRDCVAADQRAVLYQARGIGTWKLVPAAPAQGVLMNTSAKWTNKRFSTLPKNRSGRSASPTRAAAWRRFAISMRGRGLNVADTSMSSSVGYGGASERSESLSLTRIFEAMCAPAPLFAELSWRAGR